MRTASTGLEPPPTPLLEPFELGDFAFEPDDFELADFGFAAFLVALGFADFDFAALGFALDFVLGFDCALGLLDEPALFDAGCFLDLVSAIFLSPRGGVPYWVKYPIHWRQITLGAAESA